MDWNEWLVCADELIADDEETEKEKALDGALWEELNKRIQEAQQTKGDHILKALWNLSSDHLHSDCHKLKVTCVWHALVQPGKCESLLESGIWRT